MVRNSQKNMLKSVGDQQQPGNIKVSQTSVQAGAGSKNKK